MKSYSSIRPSPIAGSWYPDDPDTLTGMIDGFIDEARPFEIKEEIVGLIAPHAGYFYSGKTAGYAYRTVKGKSFDICAVFSPLHDYLPYQFLTTAHEAYQTPLGQIQVDQDLVAACVEGVHKETGEVIQPIGNDREHSLEIQLPFLQRALIAPFKLLPVMVRTHNPDLLKATARVIANCLEGKRVLLVASTDLSHFFSESEANVLDSVMLKHICEYSPEGVLKAEETGEGSACGAGAVALVLWLSKFLGGRDVTLLNHSTSADASGDTDRVVGYGAAVITK